MGQKALALAKRRYSTVHCLYDPLLDVMAQQQNSIAFEMFLEENILLQI